MDHFETELARWDRGILVAQWNVALGRKAYPERWEVGRARLLGDSRLLRFGEETLRRPLPSLLERRVQLMQRGAEDVQVEHRPEIAKLRNDILRADAAHKVVVHGKKVPAYRTYEMVRKAKDPRERRHVWEAVQRAGHPLEAQLQELARRRNEGARALGYATFVDLRLAEEGLTRAQLEGFLREVGEITRGSMRRLRQEFHERDPEAGWHPWDVSYSMRAHQPDVDRHFPGRSMLATVEAGLRGWGLRPDRSRIRVVRAGIPFGGVTYACTIPTDIRVAVNPVDGWGNLGVLFHEMGHAVHHASTRASSHLLRGYETLPGEAGLAEGIGGFFEELPVDEGWLRSRKNLPRELIPELLAHRGLHAAYWAGWLSVWVRKELELYLDPDRDLRTLYTKMDRDLMGFDEAPPASFVDSIWVQYGFYAKSYLLAWLFSAQVRQAVLRDVGGELWPNRRIGPWMVEHWFRDGYGFDWVPHMKEVTGRPLGTAALRHHLRSLGA